MKEVEELSKEVSEVDYDKESFPDTSVTSEIEKVTVKEAVTQVKEEPRQEYIEMTKKESKLPAEGTVTLINKLREDLTIPYFDEEFIIPPQGSVTVEVSGIHEDKLPSSVIVSTN